MTKPAKPGAEGNVHSGETSTSQHFVVGKLMLPLYYENTTEASLVEGVNFFSCIVDRVTLKTNFKQQQILINT